MAEKHLVVSPETHRLILVYKFNHGYASVDELLQAWLKEHMEKASHDERTADQAR